MIWQAESTSRGLQIVKGGNVNKHHDNTIAIITTTTTLLTDSDAFYCFIWSISLRIRLENSDVDMVALQNYPYSSSLAS